MDLSTLLNKKLVLTMCLEDKVPTPPTPVPPGPGPVPTPPPPAPTPTYDTTQNGLLSEEYATSLDPVGTPDQVRVTSIGYPFMYVGNIPNFPRSGWCQKWTGALMVPSDGEYTFSAVVKSSAYVKVDGTMVMRTNDREDDPGSHTQYPITGKITLKKGLVPFESVFRVQGAENVYTIQWGIAPILQSLSFTDFVPPGDWKTRVKTYAPAPTPPPTPGPAPTPFPVVPQPDWTTYKSPDLGPLKFLTQTSWTQDITNSPVHAESTTLIAGQGTSHLHPDFGFGLNGIPCQIIPAGTAKVNVTFDVPDESDKGPYPIPWPPVLEHGTPGNYDFHWIGVSLEENKIYEIYQLQKVGDVWKGYSGAIWDIGKETKRPIGWTSADGAGMPMLPGLIRYEEVAAGKIEHALRFTVGTTRKGFIYPANHDASVSTNPNYPPMGSRWRLKASVDTSAFGPQAKVILEALKKYGMIVADNGSNGFLFVSGTPDSRWDDNDLATMKKLHAADFEVVAA